MDMYKKAHEAIRKNPEREVKEPKEVFVPFLTCFSYSLHSRLCYIWKTWLFSGMF